MSLTMHQFTLPPLQLGKIARNFSTGETSSSLQVLWKTCLVSLPTNKPLYLSFDCLVSCTRRATFNLKFSNPRRIRTVLETYSWASLGSQVTFKEFPTRCISISKSWSLRQETEERVVFPEDIASVRRSRIFCDSVFNTKTAGMY